MSAPAEWRVVARAWDGKIVSVATRIATKDEADRLAARLFGRGDVSGVEVTLEPAPPAPRRRSYR
jgi:hypothetical protein